MIALGVAKLKMFFAGKRNLSLNKAKKEKKKRSPFALAVLCLAISLGDTPGRGGTLGISRWGCATRTLEPLAYTKASFSWILLPCTRVNSPNHYYPRQLMIPSSVL